MRTRELGRTGRQVSIVGQGTFGFERAGRKKVDAAVRRGVELGMTHVDTAEMYGSGDVERLLAGALRGIRDQVFLVSKVLPKNASYEGTLAACEGSLRRLQTDRLDCYLLHWFEGQHPLEETFRAFEKLQQDGKIACFGVSNFEVADLQAALRIVGEGRIAMNQVEYHLRRRGIERELIPLCEDHGVSVVAYSPFGEGRLPGPLSREGRALGRIAREAGATVPQTALAFLLRRALAIPKAVRLEHLEDNARAAAIELSRDAIDALDRTFPVT